MQALKPTQLVFLFCMKFLKVWCVLANDEFCGRVFKTQVGKLKTRRGPHELNLPYAFLSVHQLIGHKFLFAGHVLVGHVTTKTDVLDEFECQLKCVANNSCKSFNVHPKGNHAKYICELNNRTRQMKPGDFKQKKGSTYFGSVQVS